MSTPPKLLRAALPSLVCALLCAIPATASASRARTARNSHGQRRLHHVKRSARLPRCRAAARHRQCGAGAGGTSAGKQRPLVPHNAKVRVPRTKSPSTRESTAATIAAVLATPCQNTELVPAAGNLSTVRSAALCLINRVRAEHGESPLQANPQLEEAAEGHCQELIAEDYFAHVSPSGETPVDRIQKTGYVPSPSDGYVIGENLAWGTYVLATPQAIVAAWIASPGHLANILETQYRETGIAITPAVPQSLGEGNPGATYAQEFGVIVH